MLWVLSTAMAWKAWDSIFGIDIAFKFAMFNTEDSMKIALFGLFLAATLLVGGQAQAGFGGGMGAWWMDGDEAPQVGGGVCATCAGVPGTGFQGTGFQGAGVAPGTGAGLALGFGDGTLPQPQDGTGFGSPWMQ